MSSSDEESCTGTDLTRERETLEGPAVAFEDEEERTTERDEEDAVSVETHKDVDDISIQVFVFINDNLPSELLTLTSW